MLRTIMLRPKTEPTLCASLHSHNALGHVTRATFYGNLLEKCRAPKPRRRLCASLRSRNPLQHFIKTTSYGNLPENAAPQNRSADFARACAIATHFNISQKALYTEIYRENATQNCGVDFARACARNARQHVTRSTLYGNLPKKIRPNSAAQTFCKPAQQSTCTSTCHKSHFIRKFTGKMPRPKTAAQTLRESAQSKCNLITFHKSHVIRKFTGKMPRPINCAAQTLCEPALEMHVNISKAFYIYRKNAPQNCGVVFVRACARHARQHATSHFIRKVAGKMRPKTAAQTLREPAQSKYTNMPQEPLYTGIYRKNAVPQNRGADFVRACAVEIHFNISYMSHVIRKFTGKNAAPQSEHPDQAPAFTLTVRTPQCGQFLFGE